MERRAFLSADTVPYGAKGVRRGRPVRRLVVLAHVFALLFDLLGLLLIELGQLVAGVAHCVEYLIELRMDRLSVAMLGPLDHKGHEPRRQGGYGVPVEGRALKREPERGVSQ